jgi:hypothetical protein
MPYPKSKLALEVLCSPTLAACGGDDDSSSDDSNSSSNEDTVPNEIQSEAKPGTDTDAFFGGDQPGDSSGSISYLVIAESGKTFNVDEEVQGLSVEAAGSGTTIEYVQVFGSTDDGLEIFGGTVEATNLVVHDVEDDSLDMDDGYTGTIKKAIVRQGDGQGDHGIEADNAGPTEQATPVTRPELANVTILGNAGSSGNNTAGALLRRGFGGDLEHVAFLDNANSSTGSPSGPFGAGVIDNDDQIDKDLNANGISWNSSADLFESDNDSLGNKWSNGDAEGGASVNYEVTNDGSASYDETTFQVTTTASTSGNADTADNFYGAVDPVETSPFWWQDWTVTVDNASNNPTLSTDVDVDLTAGNSANWTHPLEDNFGGGDITPASGDCPADADGDKLKKNGTASIGGETFTVCVINQPIDADLTLTNGFIYVLKGNIKVGNGDVQDTLPEDAADATLTIDKGTQVYGAEGTSTLLRVTRGATINVNGTADKPVVMAGVTYSDTNGITGDPEDLSGRGDWGGLVVDGYAPTNSNDN